MPTGLQWDAGRWDVDHWDLVLEVYWPHSSRATVDGVGAAGDPVQHQLLDYSVIGLGGRPGHRTPPSTPKRDERRVGHRA